MNIFTIIVIILLFIGMLSSILYVCICGKTSVQDVQQPKKAFEDVQPETIVRVIKN